MIGKWPTSSVLIGGSSDHPYRLDFISRKLPAVLAWACRQAGAKSFTFPMGRHPYNLIFSYSTLRNFLMILAPPVKF